VGPNILSCHIGHLLESDSWQWKERSLVSSRRRSSHRSNSRFQSSTVIEHFELESPTRDIPHLYYFFDFRIESTRTCENFLRSILVQLLFLLPEVPYVMKEWYLYYDAGRRRPSIKHLTACFISVIETIEEARLFMDGFDECHERDHLWYFISEIARRKCLPLRFLFTSCPERHIQNLVNSFNIPTVELAGDAINADIMTFVTGVLDTSPRFARFPVKWKELVRESLTTRAGGMYELLLYLGVLFRISDPSLGSVGSHFNSKQFQAVTL
jgi:hypothetical protein